MPYLTGFELLAGLPNISFNLVFVTAYNQYAIEAFKHNAINYLLKPVLQDDLKKQSRDWRTSRIIKMPLWRIELKP